MSVSPLQDSALTGAAGEHYVIHLLHRRGLIAALAPPGVHTADIIVFSPEMAVGSMVQVKTRTRGRDQGWHMSEKHEHHKHDRLFYAFVDFEPEVPSVYIVPSAVVATIVVNSHLAWLSAPGKNGHVHQHHSMRRIRPSYPYEVEGAEPDWLNSYHDRWGLLTIDPRLGEQTR